MITLAFAQMAYYVASGLSRYGGDDGLTIYKRSDFGGLINLSNRVQFYYLCLALPVRRPLSDLAHRQFALRHGGAGPALQRARMQAIGFPANRYRLVCFVIAGTICGLAGALLANNTDFVSPAVMYWTRSGDLMVMVILGGMGSLFGPVIGAIVYLVLEELLSQVTEYWATDHGAAAAADRAVRARRHHGPAREDAPWLNPCSASKIWCAGSAASSRPTICRSMSRPANCTPSSARTAPARPR